MTTLPFQVPELAPTKPPCRRGTTNTNVRGNSEQRRRRRQWLVETYRANVDLSTDAAALGATGLMGVPLGMGVAACRCYRCGVLLTEDTVTVDRIKPGIEGGTYKRNNIRPACGDCNSETGGALGARRKARRG